MHQIGLRQGFGRPPDVMSSQEARPLDPQFCQATAYLQRLRIVRPTCRPIDHVRVQLHQGVVFSDVQKARADVLKKRCEYLVLTVKLEDKMT